MKHLSRKGKAIIIIIFFSRFKMVVDIVKIALHDERPIISRTDAYCGRVMVTSKKQGGGGD